MTQTKLNPLQTNDNILSSSIFRQALINGNFDVWQRGVSITANSVFSADRWKHYFTGTSITLTPDTDVPNTLSKYSLKGVYVTGGANKDIYHFQRIEGIDAGKFSGKQVTYSFWIKASAAAGTINIAQVYFEYPSAVDNWGTFENATGASYAFTPTSSWTKVTGTVTLPATSATGYSIANGLSFNINLRASDNTTLTYRIAQVQLCAGDVALPFMPKSKQEEERDCMRYYQKDIGGAYNSFVNTYNHTTTSAIGTYFFIVPMRIAPTLEVNSTANKYLLLTGGTTVSCSSVPTINNANTITAQINAIVASGLTVGQAGLLRDSGDGTAYLGFNSEL